MVGNIPNFTKIDILRCFLRLSKNVGRQELARELELGEGTMRSILNLLKSKSLLDSTKKGHFLSRKGKEKIDEILECVSIPRKMPFHDLYPEFKKIGIVVKNAQRLKDTYKLRDIAVKNGAEGAMILRFEKKLFAPDSDLKQDFYELEKFFELRNGDSLIIGFAEKNRNAESGTFSIAVEMKETLKKFINDF